MEIKIKHLPLLLLMAALSACGSTSKTSQIPNWIDNPNSVYPDSKWLTAVGSGTSNQDAQNKALGNLARIFESNITVDQTLMTSYSDVVSSVDPNKDWKKTQELLSSTQISADQSLINTRILETYSSAEGTTYALAGIERRPTGMMYSQEITSNEMLMAELNRSKNGTQDPLKKLGFLKQASILAEVNSQLASRRKVIMNNAIGDPLGAEERQNINAEIIDLKSQVVIRMTPAPGMDADILTAIQNAFQAEGFSIGKENAILEAKPTFETTKMTMGREDAEFAKWTVKVDVTDLRNGNKLESFIVEDRDGAINFDEAIIRSKIQARKVIKAEFPKYVNQQLLSLESYD